MLPLVWLLSTQGVSTIVLVVPNVHLWNATHNTLHDVHKVRKWCLEVGNTVDAMLAFKIITIYYVRLIFLGLKDLCQCVVTVGKSVANSEKY
jgi:hypothetical protein